MHVIKTNKSWVHHVGRINVGDDAMKPNYIRMNQIPAT